LIDEKVCGGAEVGSDNALLVTKLKVKIAIVKKKSIQIYQRYDTSKN